MLLRAFNLELTQKHDLASLLVRAEQTRCRCWQRERRQDAFGGGTRNVSNTQHHCIRHFVRRVSHDTDVH